MAEKKSDKPTFEKNMSELEKIVALLEDGKLPLDGALVAFEQGVKLSNECLKQLDEGEARVEKLLGKDDKSDEV